ncbi:MAG: DUF72 domain-containing protein [Gammaproteobacteria bacterium]
MTKYPRIHIGTSGWTYPEWAGKFYPAELPQKDWLPYYCQHFDTVELNATFYRQFPAKTFAHWYEETPEHFKFVIKVSGYITHRKHLKETDRYIKRFEKDVWHLQDKLGLLLLQFPPHMPYDPERLKAALAAFKDPSRVVVEFRDAKWLTDEVKSLLQDFKAIFCNVDSPILQVYDTITAPVAYLRLHGHSKMYDYNYKMPQLTQIQHNIHQLIQQGAREVYILFNNDMHAYAPKNALKLQTLCKN